MPAPKNCFIIKGRYKESFASDEKLYLVSEFSPGNDFSSPDNFLPEYTSFGKESFIVPNTSDIPSNQSTCAITSVCRLDTGTLELEDVYSSFIYSKNISIGEDSIFISYAYEKTDEGKDYKKNCYMTDIAAVSHSDGQLYLKGVYSLEGAIFYDTFCLNEKDGILRAVTETYDTEYSKKTSWLGVTQYTRTLSERSISLYCIDTESGRVVASLEKFIRQQQEKKPYLSPSLGFVRFEGNRVYVNGAYLSDKGSILYTLDMSDLTNLTYTASEPVRIEPPCTMYDFGDDLILGVGNASGNPGPIKVEIYQKTADGKIKMICTAAGKYRYDGYFIQNSTFVDRESRLVGFVSKGESYDSLHYFILRFNGETFEEIFVSDDINTNEIDLDDLCDGIRSFIHEGCLYVFTPDKLLIQKLPG